MNNSTGPADPGNEDMALAGALFMVGLGARVLPVAHRTKRALLKDWGKSRELIFIPEYEFLTLQKTRVRPDGALLHALRVPLGYARSSTPTASRTTKRR